jgi:hypothetical protein
MNNLRLKTGLQFGAITSGLNILIGLALLLMGLVDYSGGSSGWVTFLILIMGIYLAANHFKSKNEGYMSANDLIVTSLWLGLITGVISGIYAIVYMQIDPTMMEKARNIAEARMEEQGSSEEQIEMAMSMMDKFMTPGFLLGMSILMNTIFGLVIGTILSFFLKKDKPIFD